MLINLLRLAFPHDLAIRATTRQIKVSVVGNRNGGTAENEKSSNHPHFRLRTIEHWPISLIVDRKD